MRSPYFLASCVMPWCGFSIEEINWCKLPISGNFHGPGGVLGFVVVLRRKTERMMMMMVVKRNGIAVSIAFLLSKMIEVWWAIGDFID